MVKSQINVEINETLIEKHSKQMKGYSKFWLGMYITITLAYLVLTALV